MNKKLVKTLIVIAVIAGVFLIASVIVNRLNITELLKSLHGG
jgi:hypothetical protein